MTYTLSADFFQRIGYSSFSDILFPFTNIQRPDIKMGVDEKSLIIDRYKKVMSEGYGDLFQIWLTLMTANRDTSFTYVPVELNLVPEKEYCLKLVSSIRGQRKLIVDSLQNVSFLIDSNNTTTYDGQQINVIERCVAKQEINQVARNTTINNISVIDSENVDIDNQSNNSNTQNNDGQ